MAIQHTSRTGKTYYLHTGAKRGGGIQYFFSMQSSGSLAGHLPEGFEIYESVNGQIFLRRKQAGLIRDEETTGIERRQSPRPPTEMKIVLDTNVVVSGLLQARGNPAQVLALVLSGAVRICHDKRILAEYAEVLARPRFKFDPRRVREVLNKIEADGLGTDASGEFNLNLPDPDDEPFLAVAVAA